jgi:hypothetical protein
MPLNESWELEFKWDRGTKPSSTRSQYSIRYPDGRNTHAAARSKELPSIPKAGMCPSHGSTYGKVGGCFSAAFFWRSGEVDSHSVTRYVKSSGVRMATATVILQSQFRGPYSSTRFSSMMSSLDFNEVEQLKACHRWYRVQLIMVWRERGP